jgi:hypothetical protein
VRRHADTDPDPDADADPDPDPNPNPNPNPDGTDGAENNLPELPFGQELRGELHQQQMDRA